MNEYPINNDALDQLIKGLGRIGFPDEDKEQRDNLRRDFQQRYNKQKIDGLTKEDYFAGLGPKGNCLAYDLEWGTVLLGSIKGGSNYKYGYESEFAKIKSLLQKVLALDAPTAYGHNGTLSKEMVEIATLSKEIHGFKTGRTVIPKLLSIYYSTTFLAIFNDQDRFLSKLLFGLPETGSVGLRLYLEYNAELVRIKERLEEITGKAIDNFEFVQLLYYAFPKASENDVVGSTAEPEKQREQEFEALEVQHYQTLLYRNMAKLFPKLKHFDSEQAGRKNGQYDTQAVGIMDMLCIDENNDFVVIEIKRQGTDKTIGQILRYMGWTKEELCKDGQRVKGIIIAERKDKLLDFALKAIPEVSFVKLGLAITLEEDQPIGA